MLSNEPKFRAMIQQEQQMFCGELTLSPHLVLTIRQTAARTEGVMLGDPVVAHRPQVLGKEVAHRDSSAPESLHKGQALGAQRGKGTRVREPRGVSQCLWPGTDSQGQGMLEVELNCPWT